MAKIFGIGLNKTGTTTLGSCLKQLGYRHSSFSLELLEASQRGDWSPIQRQIDAHDSFEDWPYPLLFERLTSFIRVACSSSAGGAALRYGSRA